MCTISLLASVLSHILKAVVDSDAILTTSARTRVRTFSPISGEMSLPNCCRVVRKRFNLLSCRAPQVAGNCWLVSADDVEEAGPLLNLCGGDGAPLRVGGEWLMPLLTKRKTWFKCKSQWSVIFSFLHSLSFIDLNFVNHMIKVYRRHWVSPQQHCFQWDRWPGKKW